MEEAEVEELLEAIFCTYGYDFRHYSRAHVKRRIEAHMRSAGQGSVAGLQRQVLRDPDHAGTLFESLSITVTEMFRDPEFHRALRERVLPLLGTWSHIKIWHAGCSTGQEVYSMAILLKEEGLYDRVQIYATDLNQRALEQAAEGIYPLEMMKGYARNYQRSGGTGSFADHCLAKYGSAIMDASLKKNIVWSCHNLVTDSDFVEAQMVVCRNVLIYFDRHLQQRVHGLFHRSLVNGGVLCLGSKETIDHTGHQEQYEALDRKQRIYRKKYPAR